MTSPQYCTEGTRHPRQCLVPDANLDYSRRADIGSRGRVALFLVHNIIFSAQCTNLPILATSPKRAAYLDVTEFQTTAIPAVALDPITVDVPAATSTPIVR
jgi:hypothetical protein